MNSSLKNGLSDKSMYSAFFIYCKRSFFSVEYFTVPSKELLFIAIHFSFNSPGKRPVLTAFSMFISAENPPEI